jgi:hypothetical protein
MMDDDRLDALLARHFRDGRDAADGHDAALGARVLAALPAQLPPQRRSWRLWPKELLDWTFAPAWPRLAALASCAVLGFAVGVAGPILRDRHVALVVAQQADDGLTSVLSEPEPLTGVLP